MAACFLLHGADGRVQCDRDLIRARRVDEVVRACELEEGNGNVAVLGPVSMPSEVLPEP